MPALELPLWQWLIVFGVASGGVIGCGIVLARSCDEIARRTGVGGLLVGMLLLAFATSLPELLSGVTAAVADAPDIAVGDLFGSSMANMAILAIIDLGYRRRVWLSVGIGHARLAAVAIGLTTIALFGVVAPSGLRLGPIGVEPLLIVAAYVAAAAWVRRSGNARARAERARAAGSAAEGPELLVPTGWGTERPRAPIRREIIRTALATAGILVTAPALALSAKGIADETVLGETIAGVVLVAVATSLPELVASVAAVRIGAHDLAVGNLFGSNAFNIAILVFIDAAYLPGPILAAVSTATLVAGVAAILLMAIALAAIVENDRTTIGRLEPDAALLLLAYVGTTVAIWMVSRPG
jgi:cation:H+ antiporter